MSEELVLPAQAGKLGALAPVKLAMPHICEYATNGKFPVAPAEVLYYKNAKPQMGGNNQYGDCTEIGFWNLNQCIYTASGLTLAYPGDQAIVSQYMSLTHGIDSGLVEANVLAFSKNTGQFGVQLWGYGQEDPSHIDDIKSLIYMLGGVYLGVSLPRSAEDQTNAHKPWSVVNGSPILGGHCIVALGYDAKYVYCATWGGIVSVEWAWFKTYVTEVWALLPQAIVTLDHGPLKQFDAVRLEADLNLLSA